MDGIFSLSISWSLLFWIRIVFHIKNPTRCNSVSKFYFILIWSSTCFGRHTAHHQEPKTALATSGFAYVEGCWPYSCWTLTVCKIRGCYCSFRLLMMGGVSPETCWASYKYEIKFSYTIASCWIFYVNYTMMRGSKNIKFDFIYLFIFWRCVQWKMQHWSRFLSE